MNGVNFAWKRDPDVVYIIESPEWCRQFVKEHPELRYSPKRKALITKRNYSIPIGDLILRFRGQWRGMSVAEFKKKCYLLVPDAGSK